MEEDQANQEKLKSKDCPADLSHSKDMSSIEQMFFTGNVVSMQQ